MTVADATPLIALARIGAFSLLQDVLHDLVILSLPTCQVEKGKLAGWFLGDEQFWGRFTFTLVFRLWCFIATGWPFKA